MLQELPLSDSRRTIHSQKPDCGPTLGGQREDFAIAKLIVVIPAIMAWMKQRRELSGIGIDGRYVTAFEPIADRATQCEILHNGLAAMLHRDHVINLVFRQGESF
jgi:hypothetical protein